MVRFFNGTEEERELCLKPAAAFGKCRKSNVLEQEGTVLEEKEGVYRLMVKPCEIITIGMKE